MLFSERIEDSVVQIVSDKLGLSKHIVDTVNQFQWKIVHEGINLYNDIEITGLGRITVRPNIVEKQIKNFEKTIAADLNNPISISPFHFHH